MSESQWIYIDGGYFTAAVELVDNVVVRVPPILGYMKGWTMQKVKSYGKEKGWKGKLTHDRGVSNLTVARHGGPGEG